MPKRNNEVQPSFPLIQNVSAGKLGFTSKQAPAVTPEQALRIMSKRVVSAKSLSEYENRSNQSQIQSFAASPGTAGNTVSTPPSTVAELARALKDDADLIFYHVYNNIQFHPTFGLQKGSVGTMIDGIGNAFDQCQLLVDLLTEAGYTASFLFGTLDLSQEEASAWLGVDSASIWNANNILANGGIPVTPVWTGMVYRLEVSHVWVKVTIDSVEYVLDPSFKSYTTISGINLSTAMSYSRSGFLDEADDGSTIDTNGNWIQDVNTGNIATELETYSENLIDYIQTNNADASLAEILGGREIDKIDSPVRQTSHPYQKLSPTVWSSIPNTYRITVRFVYDTIDETLYGDEVHGKRVTVFFNGSNEAELRVDGTLIDTSSAQSTGTSASMQVTVTHPYAVTWYDQTVWMWLSAPFVGGGSAFYLIGTCFGVTNENLVQLHNRSYIANSYVSGSSMSEPILGEHLSVIWHNYLGQLFSTSDILGRMTNCFRNEHHHVGLCFYNDYSTGSDTMGFDIGGAMGTTTSMDGTSANATKFTTALAMHGYCLEMLAQQQFSNNLGISTTRVLDVANASGDKIYKGTDTNWDTDVTPNLSGYSSTDLDNIEAWYLDNGWSCLIPESAPVSFGGLNNTGYAVVNPGGGAIGIVNSTLGGVIITDIDGIPIIWGIPPETPREDPVGMLTGSYLYKQTDVSLGSSEFPYLLKFDTSYDSRRRYENDVLGLGWTHNWKIRAAERSSGFKGLGSRSTIEAVASIVEMFVHLDLLDDTDYPILNLVSGSLCNSWWADQLTNNTVIVKSAESSAEYVLLPDGNLESWEFPNGVTITLAYSSGKLSTISNGLGRTFTLSYTGDKLTSVSDGNSRSVSYTYDVDDQLEAITDLEGEDTTFEYGSDGLLVKYFYPENPTVAFITNSYDSLDRVESQLDVNGKTISFYFAGWRSEVKNADGHSFVFEHDHRGNVIKEIDEAGNATIYSYDGLSRMIQKTMPEGNSESLTYDSRHNVLTKTRSAKPGSSLVDIVETFTYDSTYNKVATHVDGRGNTTTYTYDSPNGNLLTIELPDIGMDTPTITMTYNSRGQLLTREDETSIVTKFEYDTTKEQLEKVTVDEGMGRLNLETIYEYNAWGDVSSVTDPNGSETTYTYDDLRRLTQITDPSPLGYISKFAYDKNGNRIKVERETGDVGHPWQVLEADFSTANLKTSFKDPLGHETTLTYDDLGRVWKVTDPESNVVEYQCDVRNKLVKVIDPSMAESQVLTYTQNGLRASITDANGNTTSYTYDGFDRLDKTIYPDGTYEQFASYDKNNNIISYRTRNSETISFEFDVLNRITQKSPPGMAVVTYEYDLAGRKTKVSTPVVSGNPASGEWEFTYDTAGRLISEEAPDGKIVAYELDENGNTTKITHPDSYYIVRIYDELNRLTGIKLNGSSIATAEMDYDNLSRMIKLSFDNSVESDYSYEWNDDLSAIEHTFSGSDLDFTYSFNDANQVVSQIVSDSQHMWHPSAAGIGEFGTSNDMNQLPFATGSCGRLFKGYNPNGCLNDDGVWKFTYNAENQLVSATDGSVSVEYVYDPMGRQIQRNVDGVKTRYVYSGWQRIADYNGNTDSLQDRYVAGKVLDDYLIQVSSGGTSTYYHADRLGSIVAITDNTGAIVNRNKYSPWGESGGISGTTIGFTGQRYDSETDLYYFKGRYYSASLGRFLQPDPAFYGFNGLLNGSADSLNLYEYATNDPLNLVDPLGNIPDPKTVAALKTTAVVVGVMAA